MRLKPTYGAASMKRQKGAKPRPCPPKKFFAQTCMPTEAGRGGTDLPGCRSARHRAGDGTRPRRGVSGRRYRACRRRVQGDAGTPRKVRTFARARYAHLGAGDPRGGYGRGDDRAEADRGNHVLRFSRGLLRLSCQSLFEEPLYDQRAGEMPIGGANGQRSRLSLWSATQPERRELVHGDSRVEGGGSFDAP